MSTDLWPNQLQQSRYRLTEARKVVVEVIQKSKQALTPVQVFGRARRKEKELGLVSVYRTLEKLEELGLVQRVHQPHGCQAFLRAGEGTSAFTALPKVWNRHLLRGRRSGRVDQIYCSQDRLSDQGSLVAAVWTM